jgi:hypothetical protein
VPGLWLIVACAGAQVDDFVDARIAAACARHERCGTLEAAGFDDEETCEAALRHAADEEGTSCPSFDAGAEDDCLAAWDVGCEDTPDLATCEQVCGR